MAFQVALTVEHGAETVQPVEAASLKFTQQRRPARRDVRADDAVQTRKLRCGLRG
jgi:hypothetical protein